MKRSEVKRYGIWGDKVSGRFWIAVCMTVLLCACSRFQADFNNENITALQAFFQYSREQLLALGEYGCSYQIAVGFRDTDWFVVALPLVASFPTVYDFAEEWLGGNYYLRVSRGTRSRYALQCMGRAAWQGFAAMALGCVAYIALVYVKFPSYRTYGLDAAESATAMAYGATALARGLVLAKSVLHTGTLSAIAAMFALLFVVLFRDRFLAVSFLVLVEYFSMKIGLAHGVYLAVKYNDTDNAVKEYLVELLLPSSHLYYDQNFEAIFKTGYAVYLLLLGVVVLSLVGCFVYLVKRRND